MRDEKDKQVKDITNELAEKDKEMAEKDKELDKQTPKI